MQIIFLYVFTTTTTTTNNNNKKQDFANDNNILNIKSLTYDIYIIIIMYLI